MAKPVILYRDLIPGSALTASSFAELMPASLLKTYRLQAGWRSLTGVSTAALIADFGAAVPIGVVGLLEWSGDTGSTFRVRMSNSDATGGAGEIYDSGDLSAVFDPVYRHFIHVLPAGLSARYLRVDPTDPGASYIGAGGLVAGTAWNPAYSYQHGWTPAVESTDRVAISLGGAEWITQGYKRRRLKLRQPTTRAEVDTHGQYLMEVIGTTYPILYVRDPASANLGRDSIFGRLQSAPEFPEQSHNLHIWQVDIAELQ